MGQAKARGTFDERKAEAIAAGRIPRRLRGDNKTPLHYREQKGGITSAKMMQVAMLGALAGAMVDRR